MRGGTILTEERTGGRSRNILDFEDCRNLSEKAAEDHDGSGMAVYNGEDHVDPGAKAI